jgi:hypothetical protein
MSRHSALRRLRFAARLSRGRAPDELHVHKYATERSTSSVNHLIVVRLSSCAL